MSKKHPYTAIKYGKVRLVVGVQSFELAYSPCEDKASDSRKCLRWMRDVLDFAVARIQQDALEAATGGCIASKIITGRRN